MKNDNYYDAFVNSILSLEPKMRNLLLKAAVNAGSDNHALLYLFQAYNDLSNPLGTFLHAMLDEAKLAID